MPAVTLRDRVRVLALAVRHPGTPWYAKAIAVLTLLYALSPIDLVPDFLPLLGQLDDALFYDRSESARRARIPTGRHGAAAPCSSRGGAGARPPLLGVRASARAVIPLGLWLTRKAIHAAVWAECEARVAGGATPRGSGWKGVAVVVLLWLLLLAAGVAIARAVIRRV